MPERLAQTADSPTDVTCDALVVGARVGANGFELLDSAAAVDAALDGELSKHLARIAFKARVGDSAVVPTFSKLPAPRVAVVGLGDAPGINEIRRAAGTVSRRFSDATTVASALAEGASGSATAAEGEGYLLGSYRFTRYKSDPRPSQLQRILLLGDTSDADLERAEALASAAILARELTNEPAMTLTPEELAARARAVADEGGLECTVMEPDELKRLGFGGILGVAQGSVQPPRLIVLRYTPAQATGKVALVGKGITFDSGGLSLKDAKNMEWMKSDMGGGAAVLGAMSALKTVSPKVEVTAYIAATENMPGGDAIKPGDVITHYGGRTSEVLNTDAEGRLVLADAVAYASEQKPDAIVDVATLTGAIMVALGKKATGLFSNDDVLADELLVAAGTAGERVWKMPLYEDYRADLESEVADIKNTGSRYGGAIYGALFIKDFLPKGIPWAHLDIAAAARADSDYDEVTQGGSGVGARTLVAWLEGRGS